MGCLKRIIGAVGTLVVFGVVAYAGWRWGGGIFTRAESLIGNESAASAEAPPKQ